ncbi:KEOPS complex subunit Pcc1 [Halopenitus sp. H-Gu1]|uniref:KEOPS complex subunit Pcc1 n=1 Tax=Halopenitus sp. H-Gu1 TaxID=3242697 RepID=UPI00359F06C2
MTIDDATDVGPFSGSVADSDSAGDPDSLFGSRSPADSRPIDGENSSTFAHDLVVRFPYTDDEFARTVIDALAPEVDAIDDDRSSVELDRDGATVIVRIRARDLVALRAGFNSWTRLVDVAETVVNAGSRGTFESDSA